MAVEDLLRLVVTILAPLYRTRAQTWILGLFAEKLAFRDQRLDIHSVEVAECVSLVTVALFLVNYTRITRIYYVRNEVGPVVYFSKLVLRLNTILSLVVDPVLRPLLDHLAALADKVETRSHLLCSRPLKL